MMGSWVIGTVGRSVPIKRPSTAGTVTFVLFQLATFVRCCTIYEFNGSGFAANAFTIAHMVPVFHNTNGTFFLDNTKNHYKCSEEGGWHDFFGWEDQVRQSVLSYCTFCPARCSDTLCDRKFTLRHRVLLHLPLYHFALLLLSIRLTVAAASTLVQAVQLRQVMNVSSSCDCCLQLVPWTQEKEDSEPDAPCARLDIEAVNRVVFEDLKLTWDELDFIGIKKVPFLALSLQAHVVPQQAQPC